MVISIESPWRHFWRTTTAGLDTDELESLRADLLEFPADVLQSCALGEINRQLARRREPELEPAESQEIA